MNLTDTLGRHPLKTFAGVLVVVAVAWYLAARPEDLSWDALVAFVRNLPMLWFISAFVILPMMGFPISAFLIICGVRFGFADGMAVSGAVIFFHKLAAFYLVRGWFRDWVSLRLKRAGYAIPAIRTNRQTAFTLVFTSVRGLPYFAKIYLLALTDIPARIYFGVGVPVHILFCAFSVGVGAAVFQLDSTWTYVLVGASIAIIAGGYWLRHRFVIPAGESDEAS